MRDQTGFLWRRVGGLGGAETARTAGIMAAAGKCSSILLQAAEKVGNKKN